MPKTQKKTGKGRLDKYYHLAKEQGYRARSAFKLVQINKKFNVLEKAKVLIDLCAAPGGWLQVAAKYMPPQALIVGVDLDPIKAIPNVITHQEDITTDKCRATLRQDLKTWKADVVLHDGAPNVGSAWVHDAYSQSELVLSSLKLAVEFLNKGGCFVTKVFRSKDYNNLMWVFNQLFAKVEATKPPSSRNVSAEIFVVCRDFLAPKRIDPKFLDPKHVFQELDPTSSNMKPVDIFHPEKSRRHRDGYDDGDYTLHNARPVVEFVKTADAVTYLGTVNALVFDESEESKILSAMGATTDEIRECFKDLKVLGKKDFKNLLKWRTIARDALSPKKSKDEDMEKKEDAEQTEATPEEEAATLTDELARLSKEEQGRLKRAKRRANERRTKELTRMQLNMAIPTEIGLEQDPSMAMATEIADEALFDVARVDRADARGVVRKGLMAEADMDEEQDMILEADQRKLSRSEEDEEEEEMDSDEEQDARDAEVDEMYEQYKQRIGEKDAKFRARQARGGDSEEWHGFTGGAKPAKFGGDDDEEEGEGADLVPRTSRRSRQDDDDSSDSDSSDDDEDLSASVSSKIDFAPANASGKLSKKAAVFFDQPLFKGLDDSDDDDDEIVAPKISDVSVLASDDDENQDDAMDGEIVDQDMEGGDSASESESEDDGIEVVPQKPDHDDVWNDSEDENPKEKPDYTLMAAEAMTVAQDLINRRKTKNDIINEGFNRYAFADSESLPDWFRDDERQHSKRQLPISKEAALAIKERLKALDARPIKKIAEAKARKKYRAVQQYNKVVKKAEGLMENTEMSEKSKAASVAKLLAKGKKKPKKEVSLVVSRGTNKGKQGRPKGVKGRYKMVDSRMKKEVRADKRKAAKGKVGKRRNR